MKLNFYNARDCKPTDPDLEVFLLFEVKGHRFWSAFYADAHVEDWDDIAYWAYAPSYEDVEDEAW